MIGLDYIKETVEAIDSILNTGRRRHLVGGTLIGLSLLFGTLALTVMTTKTEQETKEEHDYESENY